MTDDGFIGLPPGFDPPAPDTDSSTVKHQRPERPEVVFRAIVPGAPPPPPPPPVGGAAVPGPPPPGLAAAPVAPSVPLATPVPPTAPAVPTAPVPVVASVPTWRLRIPGLADAVDVVTAVVLGRNPTPPASSPGAVAVSIQDPAKSVSKTHALVETTAAQLLVHDLDSTNGVWVMVAGAAPVRVEPGTPVAVPSGADLELGEFVVRVDLA